jgi:ABC-type multidrug transport system ATPase subunit
MVGGQFIRGVSGGQKRRTSIAMELLTNPQIIFLDEPTSGLDSAAALNLFYELKQLAVQQNTLVVATIHQPRSDIFDLFDKLLLLSFGYVVYQGAASEVQQYFLTAGFHCPRGWNTADFFIDVIAGPIQMGSDASKFKPNADEAAKVAETRVGSSEWSKFFFESDWGRGIADTISQTKPGGGLSELSVEIKTTSKRHRTSFQVASTPLLSLLLSLTN